MSITFHSAAAKKVKEIIQEDSEVSESIPLRVFIQGGGCSGFQYGFTFDAKKDEDEEMSDDEKDSKASKGAKGKEKALAALDKEIANLDKEKAKNKEKLSGP